MRPQTWGLDKYHGGRSGSPSNWPGVDLPPLEIPAESFLVFFHSDGTNNDYGFRLSAEGKQPFFPQAEELRGAGPCDDVNPCPMYIGQPPLHASKRKTVHGGAIARVRVWRRPLLAEEVESLARDPPPRDAARAADVGGHERGREEGTAVKVLAIVHACCRAGFGREELLVPTTVGALLRLALLGEAETRLLALRVCRVVLPWVHPGVVDEEFRCVAVRWIRDKDLVEF